MRNKIRTRIHQNEPLDLFRASGLALRIDLFGMVLIERSDVWGGTLSHHDWSVVKCLKGNTNNIPTWENCHNVSKNKRIPKQNTFYIHSADNGTVKSRPKLEIGNVMNTLRQCFNTVRNASEHTECWAVPRVVQAQKHETLGYAPCCTRMTCTT